MEKDEKVELPHHGTVRGLGGDIKKNPPHPSPKTHLSFRLFLHWVRARLYPSPLINSQTFLSLALLAKTQPAASSHREPPQRKRIHVFQNKRPLP